MIVLLLKTSIIIAIVLVFYKVFLEKESFFAANRIYLILGVSFAFALPFVSLPKLVDDQGFISTVIEQTDFRESQTLPPAPPPVSVPSENAQINSLVQRHDPVENFSSEKQETTLMDWLLWIYYFGVVVCSLNLLAQIVHVLLAVVKSTDKVQDSSSIIVNTPTLQEPCSFFNYIFINPDKYDYDTYEQIVSHEKIHVQKLHTIDLLLSEVAIIVLWFNPLIWMLRKEIEKNLEYQTDDLMVNAKTVEKKQYQLNLLRIATYKKPLIITPNYNQSLLKQRILRMNAKRSNPHSYLKYAFVAPVLFAMLLVINKPTSAIAQNGSNESYVDSCKELLKAVKEKDIVKVRELIKIAELDCTFREDGEPRSPLVSAARHGDLEIGKLLIDAGADVEFHAQGDETPLMAASASGNLDFVKYLVANGAEVNKELTGDGTALLVASRRGHVETVKFLISKGADVNGQVVSDGTPLINSVRSGHYGVTKVLLENGADPYLVSQGDEYPMYHALKSKDKSMIALLKKYEPGN